jgi:hypothetical protein
MSGHSAKQCRRSIRSPPFESEESRQSARATAPTNHSLEQLTSRWGMGHLQTLAQLIGGIVSGGIRVVDLTQPLEPATPIIGLPPQFAP